MEIKEVLDLFPATSASPGLVPSDAFCAKERIEYDKAVPDFYVAPAFSDLSTAELISCPFACLISAPAAVGKTRLSRHLQSELLGRGKHVAYIPLKGKNIGDQYFKGLIAGMFPSATPVQVRDELVQGRLVLVFDGYDEVVMTTEQMELNKGFISEIVEFFRPVLADIKCAGIIFQFRSLFFEFDIFNAILPFARHMRIEYFDGPRRRQFLNEYLGHKKTGFHNPDLVNKFLVALESRLGVASDGINPAAFFGHALVLASFGDFIIEEDEPNLLKLANSLAESTVDAAVSLRILRPIIEKIISREAQKIDSAALQAQLPGFEGLPVDLQADYLAHFAYALSSRTPGTPWEGKAAYISAAALKKLNAHAAFPGLGAAARQKVRDQYEQMLVNQLDLHPFIDPMRSQFTNQIYHELYLAQYLASHKDADADAIFENYKSASYFLGLFFLDNIPKRDLTDFSGLIHYVVSLLSMSCNGDEYSVQLKYEADGMHWTGSVLSKNVKVPNFIIREELLVYKVQPGSIIQNMDFSGSVSNASLSISCPAATYQKRVELKSTTIDVVELELAVPFLVFDGLTVRCKKIELDRSVTQIEGGDSLTLSGLRAGDDVEIVTQPRHENIRPVLEEAKVLVVNNLEEFKRKLGKVLLGFRKHGRSNYAVYELRHTNLATSFGRDEVASSIVELFHEKEIFSRDGNMLIFHQDKLAAYGIHYIQQNELSYQDGGACLYSDWKAYSSR